MGRFYKLGVVLAVSLVLAACGGETADDDEGPEPSAPETGTETSDEGAEPEPEADVEPLDLSFTYIRTAALPALVADQQGFFTDVGLNINMIEAETGGSAIEAMMGGSTHVTQAADARLPQSLAQGLPVVGIGVNNTGYSGSLVVSADNEDVQSWEDCVGLRVGATVGSGAYTVWVQYVQEEMGLDVDDFDVVSLEVPDMPGALFGDSIDCALMWQPHVARSAEEGITRVVMSPADMAEPIGVLYPFVFIAHENVVADMSEELTRFLTAMRMAQLWIMENPDEAKEIQREFIGDVSDAVNDAVFEEFDYERFVIDEEVVADLTTRAETLVATGDAESVPDLEAGINRELAEEAVARIEG